MNKKQFAELNEACCKFWIGLSEKQRLEFACGDGTLSIVDSMAEMLCINLSDKDYGLNKEGEVVNENNRVNQICDNMTAAEVAVFGKAVLIESDVKVKLVYPNWYIDVPEGDEIFGVDVTKYNCTVIQNNYDSVRFVGTRDNFSKLFFYETNKSYDKQGKYMDQLKPVEE